MRTTWQLARDAAALWWHRLPGLVGWFCLGYAGNLLGQQASAWLSTNRIAATLAFLAGAKICEMPVNHRERRYGTSKYGIGRTLRVILDLITVLFLQRYLSRPMQVFGLWGLVLSFFGFLVCAYLAFVRIAYTEPLADRPLLTMGVLMLLAGIQLVSLGLVADLLTRTYHEAQHRRPYFVRHWIEKGETTLVEKQPTRS